MCLRRDRCSTMILGKMTYDVPRDLLCWFPSSDHFDAAFDRNTQTKGRG